MILEMFVVGCANLDFFSNDAFNGALAIALDRSKIPFEAINCAKEAGAMIMIQTGSQPSLRISGELDRLMASSAPGLSPAVQTVVDLPKQTNTLS